MNKLTDEQSLQMQMMAAALRSGPPARKRSAAEMMFNNATRTGTGRRFDPHRAFDGEPLPPAGGSQYSTGGEHD